MGALKLLTNSHAKTARACLRLRHLKYVLGWKPKEQPEAARFGTLIHTGLEAWWKAIDEPEWRLVCALAAISSLATDAYDLARATVLLCGYEARWGPSAHEYTTIGVEVETTAPLRNPETGSASRTWQLGGKMDLLASEVSTGRKLIGEHKTSSEDIRPGMEYQKRLRMDGQISIYFELANALGHDVAGCLYDMIGKPGIRPSRVPLVDADLIKIVHDSAGNRVKTKDGKKWRQTADTAEGYVMQTRPETPAEFQDRLAETVAGDPAKYYQRTEIPRTDLERDGAMTDVWQLAQGLNEADRLKRAPRNPDACVRYGRTCEFFDVCTGVESLESGRFERLVNVNPELAGPPEVSPSLVTCEDCHAAYDRAKVVYCPKCFPGLSDSNPAKGASIERGRNEFEPDRCLKCHRMVTIGADFCTYCDKGKE